MRDGLWTVYIKFTVLGYTGHMGKTSGHPGKEPLLHNEEARDKAPGDEAPGCRELSPEQARRKRERFLALAREQALADAAKHDDDDSEPTVATMILPGD